ncbi:MAG: uroporphyrinogen-III synthase, partial [Rikenellaceae bacterium]|nr:uroporphyrinogen-III synthase [Rikenellaceae bacterium]
VKEFLSQRVDILSHTAVIFTNRSSIDHFFQICEETRVSVPENMKYFCVTEAIALYLQKYIVYRKRKIFFGKVTFADLMEVIVKHKEENYLLPLPDSHKPEIPQSMDKLKLKYDKVILSKAVAADIEAIDLDKYDILAFYSPSEIAILTAKYSAAIRPMIAVFGNGTAVAAVEAGLPIRVMAPTPESPSMVKALDLFITRYNSGEQIPEVTMVEKKTIDVSHLKTDTRRKSSSSKSKSAASKSGSLKKKENTAKKPGKTA